MNTNANICGVKYGNTGTDSCALDFSQINGFIITPESKAYTMNYATDAAFLTALKADTLLASKSARIYPYFRVLECTDNTADVTVQSSMFGKHIHSELNPPMLQFRLAERGINQVQQMFRFMGNNGLRMFLTDKNGVVFGQKNASGQFMGYSIDLNAMLKQKDGMNATPKMLNVYFKEEDVLINPDKFSFYAFDSGTVLKDELSGVHDVLLTLVSASTSSIVIKVQRRDNLKDLGIDYATALAQAGAYLLVLASTGAAVTVSTSTYSATAGTITLAGTFTTALHYLSLKDPTALAALATPLGNGQTGGFESQVLSVTPA